jgi:hypothetical protein
VPVLTYLTETEAAKRRCPIARTFNEGKAPNCDGSACILWRWRDLAANDPRVVSAYVREQALLLDAEKARDPATKKTADSFHKQAVARVAAAPWDFIFMGDEDRGFCGLGGRP